MEMRRPAATKTAREPRRPRAAWVLDGEAFRRLLSRLDPDPEAAGERYEVLRRKLLLFFAGRGCPEPEEGADETLDRVTRKVAEGERIEDLGAFAYGVARRVLSEAGRRDRSRRRALRRLLAPPAAASSMESEAGVECVARCTRRLEPSDRDLILEYYAGSGRQQPDERREMAARRGISPMALRLRVYRLRRSLEACTRRCLDGGLRAGQEERR